MTNAEMMLGHSESRSSSAIPGKATVSDRSNPIANFVQTRHGIPSRQPSADRKTIKKIRIYKNGDSSFCGLEYVLLVDKNKTLDSFLQELDGQLSDKLYLNLGVRYLLTLDGGVVKSLSELRENQAYVASSGLTLKKVGYGSLKSNVQGLEDSWKRRSLAEPKHARFETENIPTGVAKPCGTRKVFVFLNGPKPRKMMRLLIDEKSRRCGLFTRVLDEITDFFSPLPGPVRKLFESETGFECLDVDDLFDEEVFIASIIGKVSKADRKLDLEEQKMINKKKCLSTRNANSARSPAPNKDVPQAYVLSHRDFNSPQVSRRMTLPPKQFGGDFLGANINHNHPPDIRDRYHIGKLIGNGNFATVHESTEWRSGKRVAMKIIEKNKIRDKRLLGNEIEILRDLRHPNIVNLLDEYSFAGRLYVVMELISHGDLFSLVSEARKICEPDAVELMVGLCAALDYLHRNRVVHRDIKPENCLISKSLDGSRILKLADFGLATVIPVGACLSTVCGSPTYVAPEILTESGYCFKVDVWAAGVTLYILLCGFPPFHNDSNDQEALFSQILSGHFEYKSPYCDDVSPQARDLIGRMLRVEVEERYEPYQVLEHEWTRIHTRLKPIRELSVAASSSSDSGITLNQLPAKRSSQRTPVVCESKSAKNAPPSQKLFRKTASNSVTNLPAQTSQTTWAAEF